jgi:hypothetical protein
MPAKWPKALERTQSRRTNINAYGEAAVEAVNRYLNKPEESPKNAWRDAVFNRFGEGTSQKKCCPQNTFLGLCEAGLVRGIPQGSYTRSLINKMHAVDAVNMLRQNPKLSDFPRELWQRICLAEKAHNGQMDVVCALWNNEMIDVGPAAIDGQRK